MFTITDARSFTTRWLVMACVTLVIAASSRPAADTSIDRIVVFGTSLSDPGNAFALIHRTSTPPDYSLDPFFIPNAPYAKGGQHLSNGPTWIEQYARSAGLAWSVQPAFRDSNPRAANYAVAIARARDVGAGVDLPAQVDAFLLDAGGVAPSNALYVIEMGSNDVRDALLASAQNPAAAAAIVEAARASIAAAVQRLYDAGARHFLVWNVPNIGLTPAVQILSGVFPGAAQIGAVLTQTFNLALSATLEQLSGLPGIQIVQFDAYGLLGAIAANPGAYGLTNVTTPCVTPDVPPFACRNPDEFLFWDGIHATSAVHAIIAAEVASLLAQSGFQVGT